jgi:hypothetical protein
VLSDARSSGDIRTINRADAAIPSLYIYICINIMCPILARKRAARDVTSTREL